MEVHETVTIYKDPITQQEPEGKAVLLHREKVWTDGLEQWSVCFEGEDGAVYSRIIKVS